MKVIDSTGSTQRKSALLRKLGFAIPQYVKSRATIADLFKPNRRCGIYVLHFSNGEFYAGQARDVTRRYVQHCNSHRDIANISFKPVPQDCLTHEERSIIHELERLGWPLRNVIFTSIPRGDSDFDLIMPVSKQARWLGDLAMVDNQGTRLVNPDLRRKFLTSYAKFVRLPFTDEVRDILRMYVATGIPAIRRGEVSFWCLSCTPKRNVYARINIYWQEVFTTFSHKGALWISLHLARSPLEKRFGESLHKLLTRFPTIDHIGHRYEPGGQDQTSFEIPLTTAIEFVAMPAVISAIRLFNLRLMKKGPCIYGRYHCMDLADKVIDSH